MSRLETLDKDNWEAFLASPAAVLLVGKSDCSNCQRWSEELTAFLDEDEEWRDVRFGKVLLDKPGLTGFKRASPWLAEVETLPFNVIYVGGERSSSFLGSGIDRLTSRLKRLLREEG